MAQVGAAHAAAENRGQTGERGELSRDQHGDDEDHTNQIVVVHNEETEMTTAEAITNAIFTILSFLLFPLTCFFMFEQIKQTERGVIFRFGKLKSLEPLNPGLCLVIPFTEELKTVDVRSLVIDLKPQKVITKDMVSLTVDGIFLCQIFDPIKSITRVNDINYTVSNLVQIELRNLLGTKTMKEIMVAKANLSQILTQKVRKIASKWGMEIQSVELQEIKLPQEMQASMAVEAEAQRQANAKILSAEGEKKSALLLKEAAAEMGENSNSMMLRILQTLSSMNNASTIILPIPFDLTKLFENKSQSDERKKSKSHRSKEDE